MNPHHVKTWEQVQAWLMSKGFSPTHNVVEGGRIWVSKSKRHMIVPDHMDGFYPDFFWDDLVRRAEKIVP